MAENNSKENKPTKDFYKFKGSVEIFIAVKCYIDLSYFLVLVVVYNLAFLRTMSINNY